MPFKHTSLHAQNPLGDAKAATEKLQHAVADARAHPSADAFGQALRSQEHAEHAVAQAAADPNQLAFASRLEPFLAAEQQLMRLREEGVASADDD